MELIGKIIAVLPAREGTSARGTEWKSQDYVLETQEQYPKRCCFNVFGADRIASFNIQVGETLSVSFDIDAHEYQGRWFNSIRAWKVDRVDLNAAATAPNPAAPYTQAAPISPAPANEAPFPPAQESGSEDDLPF